jgi:DNA polymerase I-like protein with 3'-5' exonuclease and polymerase domains
MVHTSHDPGECRKALAGAGDEPIVVDCETTGLNPWFHSLLSVGILVARSAFILHVKSSRFDFVEHLVGLQGLQHALEPLRKTGSPVIFHHAKFDLLMLANAGVEINRPVYDTFKMMQMIDPDRKDQFDRRYQRRRNYKLKTLVRHELGINSPEFPGHISHADFHTHSVYLACDVICTQELFSHLSQRFNKEDHHHYQRFVSRLQPILLGMMRTGMLPDVEEAEKTKNRLLRVMAATSRLHDRIYGSPLDQGDPNLRKIIYSRWGCERVYSGRRQTGKKQGLSVKRETVLYLAKRKEHQHAKNSLLLIHDYKLAQSLMERVGALPNHIQRDGLFHTELDDVQRSGRLSSSDPNLQQLAQNVGKGGKLEFRHPRFQYITVKPRNVLQARPGFTFVAVDIAQADVRALVHRIETFPFSSESYLYSLRQQFLRQFSIRRKLKRKAPEYRIASYDDWDEIDFSPGRSGLGDLLRDEKKDFYRETAKRVLDKPELTDAERNAIKQIVLGIINGKGVVALSRDLGESRPEAQYKLDLFNETFPKFAAFKRMMQESFAITGMTRTNGDRPRRVTPHWLLVNEEVLDVRISYSKADNLWLKIIPVWPLPRVLTCYVLTAIDCGYKSKNQTLEIYNHKEKNKNGQISSLPYRFFDLKQQAYRLPFRNLPWKMIREIQTADVNVEYEGFESVVRNLFNHVAQGGTAEIAKRLMLIGDRLVESVGGLQVLQIHDELLFEIPEDRVREFSLSFSRAVRRWSHQFTVPIAIEEKRGSKFGELQKCTNTSNAGACAHTRARVRAWCHGPRSLALHANAELKAGH